MIVGKERDRKSMKKIGIITFHNAHNYGACLQAYALQQYLKSMGNDVKIIDYDSEIKKHYNLIIPVFRKNIVKYIMQLIYNIRYYKTRKRRYDVFQTFISQYLELSNQHYKTERQLKKNFPLYDYYICGSDQIWNIDLVGKLSDIFTLNFGSSNIKKISYAASIGESKFTLNEKILYQRKLSHLDKISVREPEAQILLKKILKRNISLVVDPVFLLEKKEWIKFTKNSIFIKEKYILVYSVTKSKNLIQIVNYISNITGYGVITFENEKFDNKIKAVNDASPLKFVQLIQKAEIIVSNSFHALAFALIFQKKFWIIPHNQTNSRIDNLLDLTNNKDRLIQNVEDVMRKNPLQPLKGTLAETRMQLELLKSQKYLKQSLEME